MAFSSAIKGRTRSGNKRIHYGTFTCTAVTGGDIDTGLLVCESIMLTHGGSSVEANVGVVNETLPMPGNAITIVTNNGDTGYWMAIGS